MKKQIDNAYDVENTLTLENELKYLEDKHSKLAHSQKNRKQSKKAFDILNEDEDVERRLESMKEEVAKTKQEIREKKDALRTMEEEMKAQHAQTIEMEQKCRKITFALNNKPKASSDDERGEPLTEEEVQARTAEIEQLDYTRKEEEAKYEKLIRQVEAKISQADHDKNIWAMKLKEKDQEYRLNELKIRELKRQVPHKALKPLPKDQKKQKKAKPRDPRDALKKKPTKVHKNVRTAKEVATDIEKNQEESKHEETPERRVLSPKGSHDDEDYSQDGDQQPENQADKKPQDVEKESQGSPKMPPQKAPTNVRSSTDKVSQGIGSPAPDSPPKAPKETQKSPKEASKGAKEAPKAPRDESRLSSNANEGFYDNSFSEADENGEAAKGGNIGEKKVSNISSKPFGIKPKK